jgi:hypothetical protein
LFTGFRISYRSIRRGSFGKDTPDGIAKTVVFSRLKILDS